MAVCGTPHNIMPRLLDVGVDHIMSNMINRWTVNVGSAVGRISGRLGGTSVRERPANQGTRYH